MRLEDCEFWEEYKRFNKEHPFLMFWSKTKIRMEILWYKILKFFRQVRCGDCGIRLTKKEEAKMYMACDKCVKKATEEYNSYIKKQ